MSEAIREESLSWAGHLKVEFQRLDAIIAQLGEYQTAVTHAIELPQEAFIAAHRHSQSVDVEEVHELVGMTMSNDLTKKQTGTGLSTESGRFRQGT